LKVQYRPGKFADWSQPEFVIISGRRGLGDEATSQSVKNSFRLRGAEVFHTAEDGCTRVEVTALGLTVSGVRPHVRATPTPLAGANLLQSE
jgi:hypothetical protein